MDMTRDTPRRWFRIKITWGWLPQISRGQLLDVFLQKQSWPVMKKRWWSMIVSDGMMWSASAIVAVWILGSHADSLTAGSCVPSRLVPSYRNDPSNDPSARRGPASKRFFQRLGRDPGTSDMSSPGADRNITDLSDLSPIFSNIFLTSQIFLHILWCTSTVYLLEMAGEPTGNPVHNWWLEQGFPVEFAIHQPTDGFIIDYKT